MLESEDGGAVASVAHHHVAERAERRVWQRLRGDVGELHGGVDLERQDEPVASPLLDAEEARGDVSRRRPFCLGVGPLQGRARVHLQRSGVQNG